MGSWTVAVTDFTEARTTRPAKVLTMNRLDQCSALPSAAGDVPLWEVGWLARDKFEKEFEMSCRTATFGDPRSGHREAFGRD